MKKRSKTAPAVAVVCGSNTPTGSAIVSRLHAKRSVVITIDAPGSPAHPLATFHHTGDLTDEATWAELTATVAVEADAPVKLVHTLTGPRLAAGQAGAGRYVCSAELCCRSLMPLMVAQGGAIVVLATVFGGWDNRPEADMIAGGSQAMLALMRSLALRGGPHQIRVNAVCHGLVIEAAQAEADTELRRALGRIPLPTYTQPEDVADAVLFLLGPGAGYITGSTLVVDGGQTLQSWSNAPEAEHYPRGGRG